MRQKIVAEARSWIGTGYHHCADLKGVGVDCGMLLVRVFVDCGAIAPFDPRPYSKGFYLHRGEEFYRDFALDHGSQVEAPWIGDVMLLRMGRCYSHGAIVSRLAPLTVVHALERYGRVVEEEVATVSDMVDRLETALYIDLVGSRA